MFSQSGFWFGLHYIRLVRNFTTEAGTVEDIGFVAADLAKALDVGRQQELSRRLDPDQKGVYPIHTPGGLQSLTVISESGFYDVVVRSDKPQGKALRSLVTREILPQLRPSPRLYQKRTTSFSRTARDQSQKCSNGLWRRGLGRSGFQREWQGGSQGTGWRKVPVLGRAISE